MTTVIEIDTKNLTNVFLEAAILSGMRKKVGESGSVRECGQAASGFLKYNQFSTERQWRRGRRPW